MRGARERLSGYLSWGVLLCGCLLWACATTQVGSRQYGPPPVPEGKGRLFLEAGGINELNFYIVDQGTGEEVYADMPRVSASSPSAFETGSKISRLVTDLDPGTYKVVVNTDIKDNVVVEDVQIQLGEETHVMIPVGRFQVMFTSTGELSVQMPFLIMDFHMRSVLGKGMTSSELRHFIVPEGSYKIRMEHSPTGFDQIRPVDVSFGRITPVRIGTQATDGPSSQGEVQQP